MIFINHVPGNPLEALTSRNLGFSDAAEGFVFISGTAAGLAYGTGFRPRSGQLWSTILRIGRRVWTLYLVHLFITVSALGIAAAALYWFDAPGMVQRNGIDLLFQRPLQALIGLPLMTYQLGYADILPLYVVLLGMSPMMLWLAWRAPFWLLLGSVLIWALAGQFRLNLPNAFGTGTWFFGPFSWQILFALGILTGVAMRDGRRFVPVRPWALWLAGGVLLLSLVWLRWPDLARFMNHQLWRLQEAGTPQWITSFNKNFLHLPRLLHFLALAYLLSSLRHVTRICAARPMAPFAMLGRHALPVFALGSLLAYVLQAIKTETGINPPLDLAMVLAGLALMLALAALRERLPSPSRGERSTMVATPSQSRAGSPRE